MSPALMLDPQLVERFELEARTIALLNHPNIVTIYEVDRREELHWFTMTYVAGRTLGEVMTDAEEPLPIPVIRAWLYQIADALSYAHQQGVVHRDIKPGNVLLDPRGNALVTDFGIAKVTDGDSGGLTRTGMLVGTPTYMSPEQCSSGRVSGASDQYSLGAVIYQMVTGIPPFVGPTLAVMQAHVNQTPPHIQYLRPECPDSLADAVHRMLEKRTEDRWPTMAAAIAASEATAPGFDDPARNLREDLAAPTASIQIHSQRNVVREGERNRLSVVILDPAGRQLGGRRVRWHSTLPAVAAVDSSELRAFSPGSTDIFASSGAVHTSLSITVEPDPIGDMEVRPTELSLAVGESTSVDVVVFDLDGSRLDGRSVLWSSSDPEIVQVSAAGVAEAVAPGQALIAARTGGKFVTANVSVTAAVAAPHPRPGMGSQPRRDLAGGAAPSGAAPSKVGSALSGSGGGATRSGVGAAAAPAAERRPSRKESRPERASKGVSVLAAAVGAVLVVATAVFFLKPGGTDAPSDGIPIAVVTHSTLAVGPVPVGGIVSARDSADRIWPLSAQPVELPPGEYRVEFRAPGYEAVDSVLTIGAGAAAVWTPPLRELRQLPESPASARSANLSVAGALPPGALLTARDSEGRTWALTGSSTALAPGGYSLEFRALGFEPVDSSVVLRAGQSHVWTPNIRAVPAVVTAAAPTDASLVVRGDLPDGATVIARDASRRTWTLSAQPTMLPPGSYSLEFTAPGFETESRTVALRAGQTESWAPTPRAVKVAPPPPQNDVRADRAAVERAVRDFVVAFNRRDAEIVLPLLPASVRPNWSTLFQDRGVTEFSAIVGSLDVVSVTGDAATVAFRVNLSFRSRSQNSSSELRMTGTAQRSPSGWRLAGVTIL
jgi:serine/threonine protein kinase